MLAEDYFQYARRQRDDAPLYLFDATFAQTHPQLADDYAVPHCFSEDLFEILGTKRPDYRCEYLIALAALL